MKIPLNEKPTRFEKDNLNLKIDHIYMSFKKNQLDFDAPYQRGYVWTQEQKEELITSVVEWLPINAIYWNEYEASKPYEVIDGKQRLSTIFAYMDDKFTWRGYLFSELPGIYRSLIRGFSVAVYLTRFEKQEECEHLFNRINFAGTPHVK